MAENIYARVSRIVFVGGQILTLTGKERLVEYNKWYVRLVEGSKMKRAINLHTIAYFEYRNREFRG